MPVLPQGGRASAYGFQCPRRDSESALSCKEREEKHLKSVLGYLRNNKGGCGFEGCYCGIWET